MNPFERIRRAWRIHRSAPVLRDIDQQTRELIAGRVARITQAFERGEDDRLRKVPIEAHYLLRVKASDERRIRALTGRTGAEAILPIEAYTPAAARVIRLIEGEIGYLGGRGIRVVVDPRYWGPPKVCGAGQCLVVVHPR